MAPLTFCVSGSSGGKLGGVHNFFMTEDPYLAGVLLVDHILDPLLYIRGVTGHDVVSRAGRVRELN